MITFTLCLLALIVGYFTYGRLMGRVFGPDDRKTPALTKADGVDYIPLPTWKIFMIQFLNIARLGPIFRAIMGLNSELPLICGLYWEVFCRCGARLFCRNAFLAKWRGKFAGDYRSLFGAYDEAGHERIYRYPDDFSRFCFVAGPAGLLAKLTPEAWMRRFG